VPERMLFSVKNFTAAPGQPVKVVFTNPDATDHNLVFVKPNKMAEVMGYHCDDLSIKGDRTVEHIIKYLCHPFVEFELPDCVSFLKKGVPGHYKSFQ
jgi:hypothetical protein